MMTPRLRLPRVSHDPSSPPTISEEVAIRPHRNALDMMALLLIYMLLAQFPSQWREPAITSLPIEALVVVK
jgi:hypothetical protein